MKVLLSTPPGKTSERWPPLGLLYIASSIKENRNDDVVVIDAFCENLDKDELVSRIVSHNPDVVGFNCSTHTFIDTLDVLRELKHSLDNVITVLGGYHATFTSRRILNEYEFIDFLIKGEGEESFVELLDHLESGDPLSEIPGLGFKHDGIIVNNDFQLIQDLDSIPFPDRDFVADIDYGYAHQGISLTPGKFTTICTSRGCPFRCTYCSCTALSKGKWRKRSSKNVVDELKVLSDQGYETCVFVDDSFTQDRKRVREICRLIRENDIRMRLYCEGRVDRANLDLLKDMKRSGFDVIYFGAESASEEVLEYYNKRTNPNQIREAVNNAKKAGMLAVTSYIVGAPVETREDIDLTIDLIKETRPHGIQMNILDCLVGTPIWDNLETNGITGPNDWKTNHRIYEYYDRFTKEELDEMANEGYKAHIDGWMRPRSLLEIGRLFLANSSLRRIIWANFRNPNLRRRVSSSEIYKDLESSYDSQTVD
jgi:anaerobic magnesium-protoporphyrin IX monomethyl ester cyclase